MEPFPVNLRGDPFLTRSVLSRGRAPWEYKSYPCLSSNQMLFVNYLNPLALPPVLKYVSYLRPPFSVSKQNYYAKSVMLEVEGTWDHLVPYLYFVN